MSAGQGLGNLRRGGKSRSVGPRKGTCLTFVLDARCNMGCMVVKFGRVHAAVIMHLEREGIQIMQQDALGTRAEV